MISDCLKLTVYFGERDRVNGHLTLDLLVDLYERHGLAAAILVRGTEGFGIKHRLHTQRMLTLSEDLPLVSIALDARERIEAMLPELRALLSEGLVTLERARIATLDGGDVSLPPDLRDAAKLTLYVGRHDRTHGCRASTWAVNVLQRQGVAGATVVTGVDGMIHGFRRRARFFSPNVDVPSMVIAVGTGATIAGALSQFAHGLERPLVTLEHIRVCKRDGSVLSQPSHVAETDPSGLRIWQKLMVYVSEHARHGGHPLYIALINRLRLEGAAGATAVRGTWGFSGDHAPHGDRLLAVRRRVPVVVSLIDQPDAIRRWWTVVDEITSESGLVTSEMVPAFRAVGPAGPTGGLRLARLDC